LTCLVGTHGGDDQIESFYIIEVLNWTNQKVWGPNWT